MRLVCIGLAGLALVPLAGASNAEWDERAPMPLARTEVVAATVGKEIFVLGGMPISGPASNRVDAYNPARNTWRRVPNLPLGVHHAMAAAADGKL